MAAKLSASVETLEHIERIKGTLFILLTGALLFIFSYLTLNRISRQAQELVDRNNALILADQRAMAGAFALSIAHDMNNQIMVIMAGIDDLAENSNHQTTEHIQNIRRAMNDMSRLSQQLLDMGRNSLVEEKHLCDLSNLFRNIIVMATHHQKTRDCRISLTVSPDLSCRLNPSIISQMLFNLIINAADATDGRGKIEIRSYLNNQRILIEVHDNGPGIPTELRAAVIKPFYTSKKSGHGLGFMSVIACAKIHDGIMELLDSDLGGACVRISIPQKV